MLYADSGWNFMEGENIGHNPPSLAASASYHIGDFDFTLYMPSNPQLSPSMSFLRVHVLSLLNYHIN